MMTVNSEAVFRETGFPFAVSPSVVSSLLFALLFFFTSSFTSFSFPFLFYDRPLPLARVSLLGQRVWWPTSIFKISYSNQEMERIRHPVKEMNRSQRSWGGRRCLTAEGGRQKEKKKERERERERVGRPWTSERYAYYKKTYRLITFRRCRHWSPRTALHSRSSKHSELLTHRTKRKKDTNVYAPAPEQASGIMILSCFAATHHLRQIYILHTPRVALHPGYSQERKGGKYKSPIAK